MLLFVGGISRQNRYIPHIEIKLHSSGSGGREEAKMSNGEIFLQKKQIATFAL